MFAVSELFGLWNFCQNCWNAKESTMVEVDDWKFEILSAGQMGQKRHIANDDLYVHSFRHTYVGGIINAPSHLGCHL